MRLFSLYAKATLIALALFISRGSFNEGQLEFPFGQSERAFHRSNDQVLGLVVNARVNPSIAVSDRKDEIAAQVCVIAPFRSVHVLTGRPVKIYVHGVVTIEKDFDCSRVFLSGYRCLSEPLRASEKPFAVTDQDRTNEGKECVFHALYFGRAGEEVKA